MIGGVFALGNFDGVHRGHRAILDATVSLAHARKIPSRVLTFEPHPRSFFQPHLPPFRLSPQGVKERLLCAAGIDDVAVLPFTAELASMPAKAFIDAILISHFGAEHLVAGRDFVFGHNRDGTMAKMASFLAPYGVQATQVDELGQDGESFSSTRVRELLLEGEAEAAASLLGRPWSIEGVVVKGAGLGGSVLGFPTANIDLGDYLRPKFGVYVIKAHQVGTSLSLRGVANIGQRPTVKGVGDNLEAFLFDFNRSLYGERWEFALLHFLRPEARFDTLDALRCQIQQDVANAQAYFASTTTLR